MMHGLVFGPEKSPLWSGDGSQRPKSSTHLRGLCIGGANLVEMNPAAAGSGKRTF
jgi:hypothetical protein